MRKRRHTNNKGLRGAKTGSWEREFMKRVNLPHALNPDCWCKPLHISIIGEIEMWLHRNKYGQVIGNAQLNQFIKDALDSCQYEDRATL
jgi:hypothetical protein